MNLHKYAVLFFSKILRNKGEGNVRDCVELQRFAAIFYMKSGILPSYLFAMPNIQRNNETQHFQSTEIRRLFEPQTNINRILHSGNVPCKG